MPDVSDDDGAMDVTDMPETTTAMSNPDVSGEDAEMADMPDNMPDAGECCYPGSHWYS